MSVHSTPHFHNSIGVETIHIGCKSFKCIGALPPLDHPHVFLQMGSEDEIVCPYCSTHYRYRESLAHDAAEPAQAVFAAAD